MLEEGKIDQTTSYESAAKDIEQEKKMVTALKRLSISNMMSYDPDLPIEDMEYQYQYQQQNEEQLSKSPPNSPQMRRSTSLSRRSSLKGRPSPSEEDRRGSTQEIKSDRSQQELLLDTDTLLWVPANLHPEVDPELFKIHIKTTVGEIMERKLSRKNSLSRHSSLSSSFLADDNEEQPLAEPGTPEKNIRNNDDFEADQQASSEKRFSNPSLRDLSFELENLSRLAGMNSTDAVTIARTLSSSSLGYTDVEKQAFDELSSPPHTSPNNSPRKRETDPPQNRSFIDPESPTSRKTITKMPEGRYIKPSIDYLYPHEQEQTSHQSPKSLFSSNDFSLKRSRRLDYRKLSNPSAAPGSNLQNSKAGKLAELRSTLNSASPTQITHQYHLNNQQQQQQQKSKSESKSKSKGKSKVRGARDSQALFSYRNPNISSSSQSSNNSPYPNSASSSSPIEQQFNTHKFSQHNLTAKRISHIKTQKDQYGSVKQQGYPKTSSRSSSGGSLNYSMHSSEKDKACPLQSPPGQPFRPRTTHNQHIQHSTAHAQYRQNNGKHHHRHHGREPSDSQPVPEQTKKHVFQLQIPRSGPEDEENDHPSQDGGMKNQNQEIRPIVPQIKISKDLQGQAAGNKSKQLNQNLDLLRTEINEFKESLSKMDSPTSSDNHSVSDSDVPESSDNNESDFSFEASYQNISYEDSLGIEKDVLNELDNKKSLEVEIDDGRTNERANTCVLSKNVSSEPATTEIPKEMNEDDHDEYYEIRDYGTYNRSYNNYNNYKQGISVAEQDPITDDLPVSSEDNRRSEAKYFEPISLVSNDELQKKKSFGLLQNHSSSSLISDTPEPKKTLKKKKSWPWLKERSASFTSSDGNKLPSLPETKSPTRSFSTPETSTKNVQELVYLDKESAKTHDNKLSGSVGKENMISKFFKKKRSNSNSSSADVSSLDNKSEQDSGVTLDYESDSELKKTNIGKLKGGIFKKMNKKLHHKETEKGKVQHMKSTSVTSLVSVGNRQSSAEEYHSSVSSQNSNHIDDLKRDSGINPTSEVTVAKQLKNDSPVENPKDGQILLEKGKEKEKEKEKERSRIKSKLLESRKDRALRKSEEKSRKEQEEIPNRTEIDDQVKQDESNQKEDKEVSRSALDIQEKLKKSIKRTSKANQPIEFTDSAFGFPLPPPSQSTLVMLDYRFPVHVERAIYRLSHLKLANPKRSLREQVLLSNFMYAYLNLVDHTLHLEQMNNSTESTPEVADNTNDLPFAFDNSIESDELEMSKNELDSEQISIDLDIVDLNSMLATKVEAQ